MRLRSTRSGIGLVEAVLSLAIFASLMVSFGQVVRWREANTVQMEQADLTAKLHQALGDMALELQYSGFTPDGIYPYLFEDGVTDAAFAAHSHPAPAPPVSDGDAPSREVVFLRPADLDADGIPDTVADGGLVWGLEELSFVVVPDDNGMNRVERRVDGASPRVVARDVESLVVDDAVAVGVPLGCLRLRLTLSRSARGQRLTARAERTVRLLNGGVRP